jgi:hypothetical protein
VDFVIIPHGVGVDYCTLWFGVFHAERRPEEMELHISSVGTPLPVPMQRWELIYLTERQRRTWGLSAVSLMPPKGFDDVPTRNARQDNTLEHYADPQLWCSIALLSFPIDGKEVQGGIQRLSRDRGIVDLGELIIPWLAFAWGIGNAGNPLLQDKGLPSAAFAETVMSIAGLESTPGWSSQSSCPEAIWQAAKWWYQFYAQTDGDGQLPSGIYMLRRLAAAPTN